MPRSGLVPVAVAPFVCATPPSLPGLAMRIETLTLSAPVWVASAEPIEDIGSDTASPAPPTTLGPGPSCVWISCWSCVPTFVTPLPAFVVVTDWSVVAGVSVLGPVRGDVEVELGPAEAPTVLLWWTGPLSPGLPTRTVTFRLPGEVCVAFAFATPPPPVPSAFVVPAADASACALFCCETEPTLPGVPTRTLTFELVGESWFVAAVAVALGSLPLCGRLPAAVLDASEVAWLPWLTEPVSPPCPTCVETLPFFAPDWFAVALLVAFCWLGLGGFSEEEPPD